MMSSATGDADLAKLLQTLGNALNKPEELKVPMHDMGPIEASQKRTAPSLAAAGYADARGSEPAVAISAPSDAKQRGVLGTAFKKSEDQKVVAQVSSGSSGSTDDDLAKLMGALGSALKKPNDRQVAHLHPGESPKECKVAEPAVVSSGPSDVDIAKLMGALGNALKKPEERKVLVPLQPKEFTDSTDKEPVTMPGSTDADIVKPECALGNALPKPGEQKVPMKNPEEPMQVEVVKAMSGPTDADLAKLVGALGHALKKPEEQKVLIPPAAAEDDLFQKQLLALALENDGKETCKSPSSANNKE